MTTQRRSYETGHKPKCLVIVDDTAEWDRAVYYASRWAIRVGGGVVMLRIIEIEDQNQQWLGVADIMRAEAHEDANAALDRAAGRANGIAAITPERVIREGDPTEQMLDVIENDVDIALLVLAANPGPEGPGPIISMMAKENRAATPPLCDSREKLVASIARGSFNRLFCAHGQRSHIDCGKGKSDIVLCSKFLNEDGVGPA